MTKKLGFLLICFFLSYAFCNKTIYFEAMLEHSRLHNGAVDNTVELEQKGSGFQSGLSLGN